MINLRGQVLPVISLASLLHVEATRPIPSARIVVIDDQSPFGLLVDEVTALRASSDGRRIDLQALLEREFGAILRSAAQRRERGRTSAPLAEPSSHPPTLALVCFRLADQDYGLPLDQVAEVTAFAGRTADVPGADSAIAGMMTLRGQLLPLVLLRVLLGLPADGFDRQRARVIVIRLNRALIGLVVDRTTAIEHVPNDQVDPVPPVLARGKGEAELDAICRLDAGRLVSVLSPTRLFERQTTAAILAAAEQGAENLASAATEAAPAERFVIFRLGDEHYGLPIAAVDEVVRRPDNLTRLPKAPSYVKGVMYLRGKVVPVIDQRTRFAAAGGGGRRIIVVTINQLQAGFVVDEVLEILAVPDDEIVQAPDLATEDMRVINRIATIERHGHVILLIDPEALLDRAESDLLAAVAARAGPAPRP